MKLRYVRLDEWLDEQDDTYRIDLSNAVREFTNTLDRPVDIRVQEKGGINIQIYSPTDPEELAVLWQKDVDYYSQEIRELERIIKNTRNPSTMENFVGSAGIGAALPFMLILGIDFPENHSEKLARLQNEREELTTKLDSLLEHGYWKLDTGQRAMPSYSMATVHSAYSDPWGMRVTSYSYRLKEETEFSNLVATGLRDLLKERFKRRKLNIDEKDHGYYLVDWIEE